MTTNNLYTDMKIERYHRLNLIAEYLGRSFEWTDDSVDAFIENMQDDREMEELVERGNLIHELDLWDLQEHEDKESWENH